MRTYYYSIVTSSYKQRFFRSTNILKLSVTESFLGKKFLQHSILVGGKWKIQHHFWKWKSHAMSIWWHGNTWKMQNIEWKNAKTTLSWSVVQQPSNDKAWQILYHWRYYFCKELALSTEISTFELPLKRTNSLSTRPLFTLNIFSNKIYNLQ